MTAAELENIPELSSPGEMCLYHVDVKPGGVPGAGLGHEVITDIAIMNQGESNVGFLPGSTAVVGINEIMPDAEENQAPHGAASW